MPVTSLKLPDELKKSIASVAEGFTIDEAARRLNVGRDYLVGLLDAGAIPAQGVGDARLVLRDDFFAFEEERDEGRRAGLRELSRLTDPGDGQI